MAREPVTSSNEDDIAPIIVADRRIHPARVLGEIDLDNLTGEIARAGGYRIWWGIKYAEALGEQREAKRALEFVKAETARALRLARVRAGEKITEESIKQDITLDARVQDAERALIEAEVRAKIVEAVYESVGEKQQTLRALTGAILRELDVNNPLRGLIRGHAEDLHAGREGGRQRASITTRIS